MRARSFGRREDGAALVELAFALPILLLIVWGIIDFGRLLVTVNGLTNAAREGARYAAVLATPTQAASQTSIRSVVKNAFVPLGGSGITDAQINIALSSGTPSQVTVTIRNYPWQTITPLGSMLASMATDSLTRSATFRWEQGP